MLATRLLLTYVLVSRGLMVVAQLGGPYSDELLIGPAAATGVDCPSFSVSGIGRPPSCDGPADAGFIRIDVEPMGEYVYEVPGADVRNNYVFDLTPGDYVASVYPVGRPECAEPFPFDIPEPTGCGGPCEGKYTYEISRDGCGPVFRFRAEIADADAYAWDFGPQATPSTSSAREVVVTWQTTDSPVGAALTTTVGECSNLYHANFFGSWNNPGAPPTISLATAGGECGNAKYTYSTPTVADAYRWDFGEDADPQTSTRRAGIVTLFGEPDPRTVTLAVTLAGGGCESEATQEVAVGSGAGASFTVAETITPASCDGSGGGSIQLVASPAGAYWYELDGARISGGTFGDLPAGEVTLRVYPQGEEGCAKQFTFEIPSDDAFVAGAIGFDAAEIVRECGRVVYRYTARDLGAGAEYDWTFGGGGTPATASGRSVEVTYRNPTDDRAVGLRAALGSCEASVDERLDLDVETLRAPVIAFTPGDGDCDSRTYAFASGVPADGYAWTFGPDADPATSAAPAPVVTFSGAAGQRPVRLSLTKESCTASSEIDLDYAPAPTDFTVGLIEASAVTCEDETSGGLRVEASPAGDYEYRIGTDVNRDGVFTGLPAGTITGEAYPAGQPACARAFSFAVPGPAAIPAAATDFTTEEFFRQCGATVIRFTAPETEGARYRWTFGEGANVAAADGRVALVTWGPGPDVRAVTLEVSVDGCTRQAPREVPIVVDVPLPAPEIEITAIAADCGSRTYAFSTPLAAETYAWDFGEDASPASSTAAAGEVTLAGPAGLRDVRLDVWRASCAASAEAVVDYAPDGSATDFVATVTPEAVSCGGGATGALTVAVDRPGDYRFRLGDGEEQAGGRFTGLAAGNYTIGVRRAGAPETCTQMLTAEVQPSASLDFGPLVISPSSCLGVANGSVEARGLPAGVSAELDDVSGADGGRFAALTPGDYLLQLSTTAGCTRDTVVTVPALPGPQLDLGPDLTADFGEVVTVSPVFTPGRAGVNPDSVQYIGLDSTPTQRLSLGAITFAPNRVSRQVLSVVVTDEDGCVAADELAVDVRIDRLYEVPTAFTPNGDGVNDVWYLRGGPSVVRIVSARVYSRWGGLLFSVEGAEPNDADAGWDGRLDGEALDAGVYVWTAEVEFVDGETRVFGGEVSLIR